MDSKGLHLSSFLDKGDERGKIIPRQDGGFLAVPEGDTAVDEPRGNSLAAELGATVVEVGKEVGRDGLARFDFHGVEGIRIRNQQSKSHPLARVIAIHHPVFAHADARVGGWRVGGWRGRRGRCSGA